MTIVRVKKAKNQFRKFRQLYPDFSVPSINQPSFYREEPVVEEKPKKNRSEAIDRWGHDMFDPNQQGPKSNQELVDLYGYDIRQEEGAPR